MYIAQMIVFLKRENAHVHRSNVSMHIAQMRAGVFLKLDHAHVHFPNNSMQH